MSHKLLPPALTAAALVAMMASAPARAADYLQAPGSTLVFATQYDGEIFTGRFGGFKTRLSFDPARLEAASLEVVIDLAGTDTGNDDRDSTLVGSAFFDVGKYAQARYSARTFRDLGDGRYAADGTLSLHGVSKPVTLTFTWTPGERPVLAGRARVRRLDFGIGSGDWADTALIPDEVAISTKVVLQPR
ncbi:hypothetical protein CSC70_04945 [Pseudoxanthomonas kalamensis DSM 18571]|uniref:YceI family protein n=1 Tax=Pseudoxanthomonas kalamensis TaxID=289483 RepID=UPI0013907225|nr:YceI family protein [Pseudoxanthomonas kalamensis]KAF1711266.1 hypothetical protein CSC70_04945 [Pseudoxanthomonas kalamensis DSM 18571]